MSSVELTWLQIEQVVVTELKEAHNRETTIYDDDWNINTELVSAIEMVLRYYMPADKYLEWKNGYRSSL